jgi:hypothetical protein
MSLVDLVDVHFCVFRSSHGDTGFFDAESVVYALREYAAEPVVAVKYKDVGYTLVVCCGGSGESSGSRADDSDVYSGGIHGLSSRFLRVKR